MTLSNKKKLIIFTEWIFANRFMLDNQAFRDIDDEHCYYCASIMVQMDSLKKLPRFVGFYRYEERVMSRYKKLLHSLKVLFRDLSLTFGSRKYELQRNRWHQLKSDVSHRRYRKVLGGLLIMAGCELYYLKVKLMLIFLGRESVHKSYLSQYSKAVEPPADLCRILEQVQPDVVIVPTHTQGPLEFDVVRLKERFGYSVLFLIDNWDNLSSRMVLRDVCPDYMGVWGQQSVEQAVNIHCMPPTRVEVLGCCRYDAYYALAQALFRQGQKPDSPYPFPYVLFTGCTVYYPEFKALDLMDKALSRINATLEEPIKLVYRPHPGFTEFDRL